MNKHVAELFRDWHDFYLLAGTSSATLVGLMFVAASIGANVFSQEHRNAMRAFVSPTVVHFSAVMLICMLVTIPSHTPLTLSGLLVGGGGAGLAYSGRIWIELLVQHRFEVDWVDRIFYAMVPVCGYALVVASGVLLFAEWAASSDVMAAGLMTLLFAGLRNAWDMTIWIVIRSPTRNGTSTTG